MSDRIEVKVPDIGDFTDVPVIEVLVSEGEEVEKEQSLITLESDKATMEVPSPVAGKVIELRVALEDTVSEGDVVVVLESDADDDGDGAEEGGADETEPRSREEDAPDSGSEEQPGEESSPDTEDGGDDEPEPARRESVEARVPDIGDFTDVPVIEVLVSEGDEVDEEQSLITLESDKATMEVPSPAGGTVSEVRVAVDDTVSEGDVIAIIESTGGGEDQAPKQRDEAPSPGEEDVEESRKKPRPAPASEKEPDSGSRRSPPVPLGAQSILPDRVPYASPAIRAFARDLGVDLFRVKGSGRKGRILRQDVTAYVKSVMRGEADTAGAPPGLQIAAPPKVDFSKFGETKKRELSRIRKISARNLHRNWVTIPHVTHNDAADITALEKFRKENADAAKEKGFKLTLLAFLIRASVAALKEFEDVNSSLHEDGERLVLKRYFHIGIAVDTEDGLVVPVLRDCDTKGILELAEELAEVSQRARDGKLKPEDWQGASFTISSLGGIGGTSFSPIINLPEVAILGVSRAKMEPVWDGETFQPRLMLPLSLSYDHRVIDGAQAARFTRFLAECLEDEELLEL